MTTSASWSSRSIIRYWLGLILAAILLIGEVWAMDKIWRDDGTLSSTLTLRDMQSGFAGETTKILIIEPDGRFSSSLELNGKPQGETQSGQLDAKTMAVLADAFVEHDVESLPSRYGETSPINQRQLTLAVGGRQWTFLLPPIDPSGQVMTEAQHGTPLGRIVAVREALLDSIDNAMSTSAGDCK